MGATPKKKSVMSVKECQNSSHYIAGYIAMSSMRRFLIKIAHNFIVVGSTYSRLRQPSAFAHASLEAGAPHEFRWSRAALEL